MARYQFPITIVGDGSTAEEAWSDAVEGFALEPGPCPDEGEYSKEETDDEQGEEDAVCPKCETEKIKDFMHNCPGTSNYEEIHGCPACDDVCGHCAKED